MKNYRKNNRYMWSKVLLLGVLMSAVHYSALAAEVTTPIEVSGGATRSETDDVNITSLGGATSAISAIGTNSVVSTVELSGNVKLDLQNLAAGTNIIYTEGKGNIQITGNKLDIKGQSIGALGGIVATNASDGNINITATTNIELSGTGKLIGVQATSITSSNVKINMAATNITLHAQNDNTEVVGIEAAGSINGDLAITVDGGKNITGLEVSNMQLNGATNDITINTAAGGADIRGVYTEGLNLAAGSVTNIKIIDTAADAVAVAGVHANRNLTTLADNATLNIEVSSQANGPDPGNLINTRNGNNGLVIGGSTISGTYFSSAASSRININVTGKAVDSNGGFGTAGISSSGKGIINGSLNITTSSGGAGIRLVDTRGEANKDIAANLELNGNTIVKAANGYAIVSTTYIDGYPVTGNGSQVSINKNGGSLVQLTGNLAHHTKRDSQFTINLDTEDSFLTGSSLNSNIYKVNIPGYYRQCLTDIRLANGATWNMTGIDAINTTGDSVVNKLTFANKGQLNMTASDTANAYTYEKLTTHGWLGTDGKILMNTDLQSSSIGTHTVNGNGDKIVIAKYMDENNNPKVLSPASEGTHTIDIKDTSLLTKKPAEGYLLLVQDYTENGQAKFVGGNLEKGGIFKYKPIITDTNPDPADYNDVPQDSHNWYLTGFERYGTNEEVFVNAGLAESRYIAYMNEQDTLIKRLGELRQHDKEQGVWVRIRGANNGVDGYGISRSSYVSTHLGYDWKLKEKETSKAKRYMGVALNHTNNNFDYAAGATGKGQSNVLTIYGTRLGDKGHYLDLVGKIGRMSNDYKYQGQQVEAKNWFYSLSAEYGRSIVCDKGWYYEPQVQFTYGHINGASYSSKATNISADSINSAILRAGLLVGRKFNEDKPEKNGSYYAKLFWSHEFGGDVKATMTDVYGDRFDLKQGYSGSWMTVGLGTSLNLNKKTNLYLDVEKAFGGKVSGGWAWQGGVRWRF